MNDNLYIISSTRTPKDEKEMIDSSAKKAKAPLPKFV